MKANRLSGVIGLAARILTIFFLVVGGVFAQSSKPVELNILTPFDANVIGPESIDAFQLAADKLGYKINLENIAEEPYKTKIKVGLAAGSLPDLFFTWGDADAVPFVQSKAVLPITDAVKKSGYQFNSSYIVPQVDGNLYSAPYTANDTFVVYYNKKIFQKIHKDVPKTWAEFIDVIKAVQNLKDGTAALGLGEKSRWQGDLLYNELVLREDATAFPKALKGEMKFTDAPFVEAAKKVEQLVKMGAFQKGYLQMDPPEMNELFFAGKIAMHAIGSWIFNPAIAKLGPDLGYFPFPQSKPNGNYLDASTSMFASIPNGMMVSAKTKYPAEAALFAVTYSKFVNDLKVKKGQPGWIVTDAVPTSVPHPAYAAYLADEKKITTKGPWWYNVSDTRQGEPLRDLSARQFAGVVSVDAFVQGLQKILKP